LTSTRRTPQRTRGKISSSHRHHNGGLLIAVALEQTVERLHQHHQAAELVEAMQTEASDNIPILRGSGVRLETQGAYMQALVNALRSGKELGQQVTLTGVAPPRNSILYLSPSRAAWSNAQTSGIASLLPSRKALLYARLDRNAQLEGVYEANILAAVSDVIAECAAAHYNRLDPRSADDDGSSPRPTGAAHGASES
jgi:hypothetical protein